jgi:hypothetical protein
MEVSRLRGKFWFDDTLHWEEAFENANLHERIAESSPQFSQVLRKMADDQSRIANIPRLFNS